MNQATKPSLKFKTAVFIITYLAVHFIEVIIGFHYSLSDGILNYKFLIDFSMWLIVFIGVYQVIIWMKKTYYL